MLTIASLRGRARVSEKNMGFKMLSRAKTNSNISAILMRKLRFIEIKEKSQSHTARKVKIQDLISSPSVSKTLVVPST